MDQDSLIIRCNGCGAKNRIPKSRLNDRPKCGKCGRRLAAAGVSGRPVDVTDRTFQEEVLRHPGPVLLDCWAPWCGPCKMVAPVLDQLASEYEGQVKIAKLNVDENPATASKYAIQSIPTMLFFKNGTQVNKVVGALPKSEIQQHLKPLL
ncbi:MAG: thioredoxin TrxC [Deltaproteobacteria bacterium]|nr:thioredoxin TrxC [Deltaproteobacteria bacterium]